MDIYEVEEFSFETFERLQRLVGQLGAMAEPVSEEYFRMMISSPCSHLFFLAEGSSVAGMLTVGIYPTPTGMKAWIEDVVVDPALRGWGIGRRMVNHALDFVKNRNVQTVMLTSNPSRVEANGLYRSMGFEQKTTNVFVHRSQPTTDDP